MENLIQSSNNYGISQELLVLSILSQYGTVSIPYGNSARYDCIFECNEHFYRIQIKSLNILEDGDTIVVPMRNVHPTKGIKKTYTKEQVDFIAIAYDNRVFLFEPELSNSVYTVRINEPQIITQHWIEDYELTKKLNLSFVSWEEQKQENRQKNGTRNEPKYQCKKCGGPAWNKDSMCYKCYAEERVKASNKPPREELLELLKKRTAFVTIGEKYGVSDNAVRKWCISYGLPSKSKEVNHMTAEEWSKL